MKNTFKSLLPGILIVLCCVVVVAIVVSYPSKSEKTAITGSTNAVEKVGKESQLALAVEKFRENQEKEADVTTMTMVPREPFYFGLDHISWLQYPVFGRMGQPAWELVASLLYIVLAYYFSKFLDFFLNARLQKIVSKKSTSVDTMLLNLLHGPTKLLTFVILLHYGLYLSNYLSTGLKMLVAASLAYLAVKCIDLLMLYWRERSSAGGVDKSFDEMLVPVISKSLKIFIIIVAVLLTSDNLGMNIKSVLASLSIGGLALGLAAQDTLANIFGAVSVFIDKPFRIGDRIKLDTVDGTVVSIGLRSTRVRNEDGYLVTIPNKTMGNAIITNISRRPGIKTEINFGLAYCNKADQIKQALGIIEGVYRNNQFNTNVEIVFNQFRESALNIQVAFFYKTTVYADYLKALQEMNLSLKKQFDDAGIQFAYPTRTIYVKQDKTTVQAVAA